MFSKNYGVNTTYEKLYLMGYMVHCYNMTILTANFGILKISHSKCENLKGTINSGLDFLLSPLATGIIACSNICVDVLNQAQVSLCVWSSNKSNEYILAGFVGKKCICVCVMQARCLARVEFVLHCYE